MELISTLKYDKCNVFILKDLDTRRTYKVYDYSKANSLTLGKVYCISGKVNAADKLYLILESCKEDQRYYRQQYEVFKVKDGQAG
jgi:hypothetical protein